MSFLSHPLTIILTAVPTIIGIVMSIEDIKFKNRIASLDDNELEELHHYQIKHLADRNTISPDKFDIIQAEYHKRHRDTSTH